MIRSVFLAPFEDSFRALDAGQKSRARRSIHTLASYFDGGPRPLGLGLRKLQGDYWEIRAGLDLRVLFRLRGDEAAFMLIGTHDAIRRALRR